MQPRILATTLAAILVAMPAAQATDVSRPIDLPGFRVSAVGPAGVTMILEPPETCEGTLGLATVLIDTATARIVVDVEAAVPLCSVHYVHTGVPKDPPCGGGPGRTIQCTVEADSMSLTLHPDGQFFLQLWPRPYWTVSGTLARADLP